MIEALATEAQSTGLKGVADARQPAETAAMTGIDKDAFLKLLVAQLKYQNPLSPLDGQEYLGQTAQFAAIERLEQIAKGQAETIAYQQVLLGSSLVGKEVVGTPAGDSDPVQGVVSALRFRGGTPLLLVGDREVPVDAVEEVNATSP